MRPGLTALLAAAAQRCSPPAPRVTPTTADKPSAGASASSAPPAPAPPTVGSCHALSLDEATNPVDSGNGRPVRPAAHRRHVQGRQARRARRRPPARGRLPHRPGPARQGLPAGARRLRGRRPDHPAAEPAGGRVVRALARAGRRGCELVPLRRGRAAQGGRADHPAAQDEGRARRSGRPRPLRHLRHRGPRAPRTSSGWSARRSTRGAPSTTSTCPPTPRYLAKDVAATGDAACKDVASERADGALKYTWSFEWPTRAQWQSGQRYGYCWVPEEG